jgi:hypothetical protein
MSKELDLKRYELIFKVSKDLCNTYGTDEEKVNCEELRDKTLLGNIDIDDYLDEITPIISKDDNGKSILNELKRIAGVKDFNEN